jgi:cytochrome P450
LHAAHILSAVDPATGKPIDDGHAKGEIATFMAAGFETTSHAITWTLTMLVRAGKVLKSGPDLLHGSQHIIVMMYSSSAGS